MQTAMQINYYPHVGYGLEVDEPAILAASRGVSTLATSWWMDYRTAHPFTVTTVGSTEAGCVYFVACDDRDDALRLRDIMVRVGQVPGYAVQLVCQREPRLRPAI